MLPSSSHAFSILKYIPDFNLSSSDFKNVDIIVFNNSINYHVNHKDLEYNPWNLEEHYNFIVVNPFSEFNKSEGIQIFEKEILKNNKRRDYDSYFNRELNKVYKKNVTTQASH